TFFGGAGGNNTSTTVGTANAAMNAFKAAIGGANNGNGGAYSSGFRAVNWDGVPDALATPNFLPADYFNTSGRAPGVETITPSTGVAVSQSSGSGANFGNITPSYATNFKPFSPTRLFSPIDSNIVQIYFYVPGTHSPATVRGFGAIFDDVEKLGATTIRYFEIDGSDLGTYAVPSSATSGDAEFFGRLQDAGEKAFGHVVITLGNASLGASTNEVAGVVDLAVLDDFAFAEPQGDEIFGDGFD